jgi:hypothetical protein
MDDPIFEVMDIEDTPEQDIDDAPRKKVKRNVKELTDEHKAVISARLKAGKIAAQAEREKKAPPKAAPKTITKSNTKDDAVLAEVKAMRAEMKEHRAAKAASKAVIVESPEKPTQQPPTSQPVKEREYHERMCARTGKITKIYH